MTQQELVKVRESIRRYMGHKVRFSANQGRHRYETAEGIISETYPNIFVVQVVSDDPYKNNKKMTFSYHDIVTKDLKMQLLTK